MEKNRRERRESKKRKREEGEGEKRKRKEGGRGNEKEEEEECDLERDRRKGPRGKKRFCGRDYGEREIGRVARIRRIEERKGKAETWVIITEMEELEDKEDILERGWEVRRKCGVGVDEDLTMEERRLR